MIIRLVESCDKAELECYGTEHDLYYALRECLDEWREKAKKRLGPDRHRAALNALKPPADSRRTKLSQIAAEAGLEARPHDEADHRVDIETGLG